MNTQLDDYLVGVSALPTSWGKICAYIGEKGRYSRGELRSPSLLITSAYHEVNGTPPCQSGVPLTTSTGEPI